MNQLVVAHSVTVNDRVVESFPKCQFDCGLLAGNAMGAFD
jgi:hypothetical protein